MTTGIGSDSSPLINPNDFIEVSLYSTVEDKVDTFSGQIQYENDAVEIDPRRYRWLSEKQLFASLIVSITILAIGAFFLIAFNNKASVVYAGATLTIGGAVGTLVTFLIDEAQNEES